MGGRKTGRKKKLLIYDLWLSSKEPTGSKGDRVSIPGSGRSPGEGNSNSLQYSCLGNPMGSGAWLATGRGFTKSQTPLSD